MWHDPRALNAAADALVVLAIAILVFAAAQMALRSPAFALRELTVVGELARIDRADVERAVAGRVAGNLFAARPGELRRALEALPWARRVAVRRVWPDRLEVRIEEHVALARWGDQALVNTHGERFVAASDDRLPLFAGPPGTEAEVTRRYRRFGELVAPLDTGVERLILTPRYTWQLRLASGLAIELGGDTGAERAEVRLARFVAAYPQTLGRIARNHEFVDLRYPNGFALRVPELGRLPATPSPKS